MTPHERNEVLEEAARCVENLGEPHYFQFAARMVRELKGIITKEIERCAKATAENTTYAQARFDLWTHLMESDKPFLESELDEIINLAVRVHQKISNRH